MSTTAMLIAYLCMTQIALMFNLRTAALISIFVSCFLLGELLGEVAVEVFDGNHP